MRLKSELYKKEQEEIVDKIVKILDLENKTEYTLYELDKNEEIQKKIMELIPEIRKYYAFNNLKAVGEPNKRKRPWLSIIKNLLKSKYIIESIDFRMMDNDVEIRTHKYKFIEFPEGELLRMQVHPIRPEAFLRDFLFYDYYKKKIINYNIFNKFHSTSNNAFYTIDKI